MNFGYFGYFGNRWEYCLQLHQTDDLTDDRLQSVIKVRSITSQTFDRGLLPTDDHLAKMIIHFVTFGVSPTSRKNTGSKLRMEYRLFPC